MRKWMRDRLQRRKKAPAEPSGQSSTPPPLQPAYFEAEQPENFSEAESAEPEVAAFAAEDEPVARSSKADGVANHDPEEVSPEAKSSPVRTPNSVARNKDSADKDKDKDAAKDKDKDKDGRTRRRRGGRGRGGRGREQAVAAAFAPAAVKGSVLVPAFPADGAEDEEGAGGDDDDRSPAAELAAEADALKSELPKVPAVPAAQRPPKGVVVLAIGLPGSGKSSWFKRHSVLPLSSDMVRTLLFDDVREQRFQDLVFSNLRSMLKARLIAKRPMNYVDATNLTPQERQHWIKLARDYQYEVHAIFFDVPLEVCLDRHQRRDRVVPEDVMRRMAAKLKPPAFEEGFAKITVVRVKKKEADAAVQE